MQTDTTKLIIHTGAGPKGIAGEATGKNARRGWQAMKARSVSRVRAGKVVVWSAEAPGEAAETGIGVRIRHLLLPALTLGLTGVANITLHTREKMIAIMESDYVLFARARGESSGYIVKRHALRNLVLPAITLQFGSISEIFGGSVLVEQVFSYPGLGQAAIDAGLGGDVSLLLAITVISTLFVFLGNLAANVLYGVIDPQIRRGRSHG